MPTATQSKSDVRCVGLAALALVSWLIVGTGTTPALAQDPADTSDMAVLTTEVNRELNLDASTAVALSYSATADVSLRVRVPIDGVLRELDLVPHSVRSQGYAVEVQLADGSYVIIDPGPARTFRGTIVGLDGSDVAASQLSDGLHARIVMPDGAAYWIEPIAGRVAGAAPGAHALYRSEDVIPSDGGCVALHLPADETVIQYAEFGGVAATGLFMAELAIDADYEYFQDYPTYEDAVQQIENVVNALNIQYERDVAIRHVISRIIIRTAEPDPYDETNAELLLYQFANHWKTSQASVRRDVAQLFTGKTLDGSTIGIAFVATVCSSNYGYSVVESNCSVCGSMACKSDLSAHELGHSWSADHCGDEVYPANDCSPPCPDHTMNCYLRCANQFHETLTVPEVIAYRNTRTCLDEGDELRRITITTAADSVPEGGTLQFTAIADFQYGDDMDVTSETTWSVGRSDVAAIDPNGLLTAFSVDGNACVTVSASYTFGGVTRGNSKIIVVTDTDASFAIASGNPPDGSIDARQPSQPDGSAPAGWQSFDVTFNGETCLTDAFEFAVSQEGGASAAPLIAGFEHSGPRTVRIHLSRFIEPGAWTTITHTASGTGVRVGYLPGDADGDRTAGAVDILAVIDNLNGQVPEPFEIWQCDIDRSGACAAADILRVIDLLSGADAYEPWLGRALP